MQRSLVLCDGPVINPEHISFEQLGAAPPPRAVVAAPVTAMRVRPAAADLAGALVATEYELILEALRRDCGSRERMAERLGISTRTLRYKLARMRAAGVNLRQVWSAA
jgi:two-component system response regulator FlrC